MSDLRVPFPMNDVDWLYLPFVIEKIENPDSPNGELTITRKSADPVPGPFTGIEYCTPAGSYHWAFVIEFCTRPPFRLALTEVKVSLLVYLKLALML